MAKAQRQVHAGLNQINGGVIHQQAQAQRRVLAEPLAQRGHGVLGKACGCRQTQLAAGLLALGSQLCTGAVCGFAHGSALGIKALARIRQAELAGGAVQQADARVFLQLANMLADGRGCHIQLAGRRAHGAALHHGGKNSHASEIFHGVIVKLYFKVNGAERAFSAV